MNGRPVIGLVPSFDDGETSESYTITNQKKMIDPFIENQENIKIYKNTLIFFDLH